MNLTPAFQLELSVQYHDGPGWEPIGTLRQFLRVNVLEPSQIESLMSLQPGETYSGGGGAFAEWTVRRVAT